MSIITNGFSETQFKKLRNSRLNEYFEHVFTSDSIGYNKPHAKVFHWAVSSTNTPKDRCLMIGDDPEVDIAGASKYGIDTVFFNPQKITSPYNATFEIYSLSDLQKIL